MSQFAVIGLGSFGFHVATALAEAGHQVVAIDLDEKKVEQIKDKVTQAVIYDAKEKANLSEIIGDEIDAVIVSLGKKIEESTLVTFYLKEMQVPRIIVKAINEEHGKILSLIGATEIIYPEKSEASRLAQRLTTRNLIEHIPLAEEHSIVEFAAPDSFIGKSLKELQLRNKYRVEVIAIKEVVSDKFYVVPEANFKIKPDSALILIGKDDDIAKIKLPKL